MAEKNAFIIDEDREFAKRVAAALRTDLLKVGIAEGERDPIDEINVERPDIVLMRADGREGESGYALCSRIKTNRRLASVPVFLYSAEADGETFEHHGQQEGAADAYIHFPHEPPYPMDDLRARVTEALENQAEESSEGPPPLPVAREPIKPITDEDTAFLDRVLDSLQQGAIEDPAATIPPGPPPATTSRRTTADAKLDMLRHKLRQREFELAKIMEMYRAKEREYHEWNEKLVEKDVEAQALKVTIEDYQRVAEMAQSELDRRTAEFNASFEQLLEEKVARENELIHTVAIKEKELADLEASLTATQDEVTRLTEALNSAHATLEETDQAHEKAAAELKAQLDDREGTLASVEQALADSQERTAELDTRVTAQDEAVARQQDAIVDLEALVLDLRSDLADAREALDEASNAHRFELEAYDEIVTGLQTDLDEAEATYAQVESDLKAEVAELSVALSTRRERLVSLTEAQRALEASHQRLYLEAAGREAAQEVKYNHLTDAVAAERMGWSEAEAKFERDLDQAHQKVATLLDSIADLEVVSGERIRVLGEQVDERDGWIGQLREALEGEQERGRETEARLTLAVSELDARRQGLQSEVDQRLEELAETEASHSAALAERDEAHRKLQSELQSAYDRVASLESDLSHARDHVDELAAGKSELEVEFQRQFQAQAEALASTRESAESNEAQLREQIVHLQTDVDDRNDQIEELHAQVEIERRDRMGGEERIGELQSDVQTTRRALQETEEAVQHLRETLAAREGRLVELQEGMRNEYAARQSGEAQLSELRAENDARNERIGRLEGHVAAQDEMVATLREELQHARTELESSKETVVDLRAQIAASQSSMDERSARLDDNVRRLDERDRELADARQQLAEVNSARDQAWTAKEQVQQQLDEARREWGMVREELVGERHQLSQRVDSLEREIETLQSARDGVSAENARLSEELESRLQREDQLRTDLQSGLEKVTSVDRELESERSARATAEESLARLRAEMTNISMSAQAASESADSQTRELENRIRQLALELSDANAETEQIRRVTEAELEQARSQIEALSSQVAALSAARDGLGDEATTLSQRLDDAMARTTALASEKANLEEQRVTDVRRLEQQLRNREESLTEQRADALRLGETIQRLNTELEDIRGERDDIETKYVRELEELHDQYMRKAQQADSAHAREVESLRKAALDAKRELRTSQLSTQRLEDRLRRLETDRPSRSDASADFESFIAQFSDQQGSRSGPSRRPRSSPTDDVPTSGRMTLPRATADALASPAAPHWEPEGEDDVTDVSGQIYPSTPSARSASNTRPDLVASPPEDPDDFLAAFDKEFEDIKGG